MTNKTLARRIQERDKYPDKFTRAEKNNIHTNRRGAFKSWEKSLLGNVPLLHAVLRHGLFDTRDMGEFMVAYTQLKKESRDDVVATKTRELRRVQAVRARKTLRKARSLAASKQLLNANQQALVLRLHSGELHKDTIEKNQAYGYGEGVEHVSMEVATLFRYSCNQMDRYLDRSA